MSDTSTRIKKSDVKRLNEYAVQRYNTESVPNSTLISSLLDMALDDE
jgi:hypothetical protein